VDLGFDLRYYLSLLKRRFFYIFIPLVLVAGASTAVALLLPPVYRSTAKILVESQQIPSDLVRSTVTSFAGERIEIIKQRVMTRENILRIVDKFNLFPSKRQEMSASEIVDSVQKAISVEPVNADFYGLSRDKATIAFTVSFEHRYPETAVRVANELVTLLLDENVRSRTARASEATKFLKQESSRLKMQVDALEGQIAKYKEQYGNALPENLDLRMQMLDRAKSNLRDTSRDIKASEAEKRFLNIQLVAAKDGYATGKASSLMQGRPLTPGQELERLQMDLLEKTAIYDQSHPDILALKRKIALLSREYQAEAKRRSLERRLRELDTQLQETRSHYAEQHPDVRRVTDEIKKVRGQLAALPPGSAEANASGDASTVDPVYANVQAQIDVADGRIASLQIQRTALEKQITELEASIVQTPEVERSLKALSRDYQNGVRKYDEIKAKEMQAQLAENLEEDKKAERFALLEPPTFPDTPVKPNRHKIMALGLALAMAAGGGGLLFIEALDGSIRGAAGYRTMLKRAPLVVIPYITTAREVRRRRRAIVGLLLVLVVLVIAALVALHFFYEPLDIIFLKIVQRLQ
jgi:succinoglycan biosynthesis transport protein ExoP